MACVCGPAWGTQVIGAVCVRRVWSGAPVCVTMTASPGGAVGMIFVLIFFKSTSLGDGWGAVAFGGALAPETPREAT